MAGRAGRLATDAGALFPAARLASFNRVSTSSVDAAAAAIGRIFCPHQLTPRHAAAPEFFALHNCAAFDGLSINYVAYGGSVTIDPGCLDRFFLVQVPLNGMAAIRTASREIATSPGRVASLLSPTVPTRMTWESDCAQLILLVERRLLEQRAAALAGKAVRPVEFDPEIDLAGPFGQALQARLAVLVDLAERLGPDHLLSPVAAADLRETVLGCLLHGQRHGLTEAIETFEGRTLTLPRTLRQVRERLVAQASEPLDLADLAAVAGTGIRALQLGFQRHFGMSMSDMLLDVRLAQLNARLRSARPGERIIDIAFDVGFTHLSRMASAYRAKFGETPSATLRKVD